ncbi:MAG: hypothetical protein AAF927_31035 [Bacteroidota bacterium]
MQKLFMFIALACLCLVACEDPDMPREPSKPYTGDILNQISRPPAYFGLDPFYQKYLDADGIPIFTGIEIPEEAIRRVKANVATMVAGEESMRRRLIDNYVRIVILALIEPLDTIPELADQNFKEDQRSRVGDESLAIVVIPEENILCFPNDPSEGEDVFVRTFALTMLNTAIPLIEPSFPDSLHAQYERILQSGIWDNTLAARSPEDYFAEGVQTWFNVNRQADPADGEHNLVDTRIELAAYDPALYDMLARFFADDLELDSCSL